MNILVIGCGKVGSQLANQLSRQGHDVSIVDSAPESFTRLSDNFSGYTVTGVPIDLEILREAGVEGCDALTAVTDDDNMNVMVCQVAREIFHVPKVLARIYDPRRGDVFSQFGLHTICPTNISVDAIYTMLTSNEKTQNVYLDSSTIAFDRITPTIKQIGMSITSMCAGNNNRSMLFGVLHDDGNLSLAHAGSDEVIREGDWLLYSRVID